MPLESPTDKRGKHASANKTPQEDLHYIRQHIESFPRYSSHYSRFSNPQMKYFPSDLNIHKLYLLYSKSCEKDDRNPAKESYYRHIFNTQINLSLKDHIPIHVPRVTLWISR